ncbi:MAG: CpXC domain-containing protein [Candidatus Thorarchaeota archaeon]
MTGTSIAEIKCEKCKNTFETQIVEHIDLSEDRDIIKALKIGKANRVQCPKCKKVMYLDRSIVVNFEPENRIVVYDPKATTDEAKAVFRIEYDSIIAFNEILQEIGAETEFSVFSNLDDLKVLLEEYEKAHN